MTLELRELREGLGRGGREGFEKTPNPQADRWVSGWWWDRPGIFVARKRGRVFDGCCSWGVGISISGRGAVSGLLSGRRTAHGGARQGFQDSDRQATAVDEDRRRQDALSSRRMEAAYYLLKARSEQLTESPTGGNEQELDEGVSSEGPPRDCGQDQACSGGDSGLWRGSRKASTGLRPLPRSIDVAL